MPKHVQPERRFYAGATNYDRISENIYSRFLYILCPTVPHLESNKLNWMLILYDYPDDKL